MDSVMALPGPPASVITDRLSISSLRPGNARQQGMGNAGLTFADDISLIEHNPAGLGLIRNPLHSSSFLLFYEPLLPSAQLSQLFLLNLAYCFKPVSNDYGGFSITSRRLTFGPNSFTDEDGRTVAYTRDVLSEFSLGWGMNFDVFGWEKQCIGVKLKFVGGPDYLEEARIQRIGLLFDAGFHCTLPGNFRLAAVVGNVGMRIDSVEYNAIRQVIGDNEDLYYRGGFSVGEGKSLTPTEISVGVGYGSVFSFIRSGSVKLNTEWNMAKRFSFNHASMGNGLKTGSGVEIDWFTRVLTRVGIEYDFERYETFLSTGLGFRVFNHIQCDTYFRTSNQPESLEKHRYGFSVRGYNLF